MIVLDEKPWDEYNLVGINILLLLWNCSQQVVEEKARKCLHFGNTINKVVFRVTYTLF